jgi:magnesium chelatase family protein
VGRYLGRISGPLLDRIDLHLSVPAVAWRELRAGEPEESSAAIRKRVIAARERQAARYASGGEAAPRANAHLGSRAVRCYCAVSGEGERLLEQAMRRLALSARAYTRILKLARTIADLAASEPIEAPHLAEAIQYRSLDRAPLPGAPGPTGR